MIYHYLSTALRHFRRHKLTTTLNVTCLAIGLICFIGIHVIVTYLRSSDLGFANAQRILALTQRTTLPGSDFSIPSSPYTGGAAASYLKIDVPELVHVARATQGQDIPVAAGANKGFLYATYADPEFFDVFEFSFLAGERNAALRGPSSVVLTQDAAARLFGDPSRALGQRLQLQGNIDVTVAGVVSAPRQPSHMGSSPSSILRYEMLISMDVAERGALRPVLERWNTPSVLTYVLLPEAGFTAADLADRLQSFGMRRAPATACKCEFGAIPLRAIREATLSMFVGADKTGLSSTALLYALGLIVLFVSCLNYANLAVAQSLTRAKEVGMRRVVGASRRQIIGEYLLEASLLTLAALAIVLVIAAALTAVAPAIGATFSVVWQQTGFWLTIVLIACSVALAAGAYPSFVLSRVRPVQALKNSRVRVSTSFAPKFMVGVQFAAASFLLIAVIVLSGQNAELRRTALQTATDPTIVVSNDLRRVTLDFDVLQRELLQQPHVTAVTAASASPWRLNCSQEMVAADAGSATGRRAVCGNYVNYDFFGALGFRLLAGRVFERSLASDAISFEDFARAASVVVDRSLASQYGWNDPQEAIGKLIYQGAWADSSSPPRPLRIVGVVEPQWFQAMGLGATSSIFLLSPERATLPIVRLAKGDVPAGLKEVESVWSKLAPGIALKWRFVDELQNDTQRVFGLVSAAFSGAALLALMIALLGLVGMSVHIIGRRTHEIGVRKTLGASAAGVVRMLLSDISKPIVIANIVAWPLALVTMQIYLSVFTHRIGLSPGPFVASFALTTAIAWIAVAVQATRAARLKPATVLRYE